MRTPAVRILALVVALAVLAAVASIAGTATTPTAKAAPTTVAKRVKIVAVPLFRTKRNTVFCGLKATGGRNVLLCWAPSSGYTILLSPGGGIPNGAPSAEHKGLPPRPAAFKLLRSGQKLQRDAFHCQALKKEAKCWNKPQHGFQLSAKGAYRF